MLRLVAKAALELVVATSLLAGIMSRETPPGSIDGLQIVFHSASTLRRGMMVMNADGTDAQRLVYNGQPIQNLECASNGAYFAFLVARTRALHLMSADGTQHEQINAEQFSVIAGVSVANDGQRVVVAGSRNQFDNPSLYVTTRASDGWRILPLDVSLVTSPSLSPDGQRIAFRTLDHARWRIGITDIAGESVMLLPGASLDGNIPVWSPDGTMLMVSSTFNGVTPNQLIDLSRMVWVRPRSREPFYFTTWSPDSHAQVFTNDRAKLAQARWDGSGLTPIANQPDGANASPCFLTARPSTLLEAASP